MPTFATFLTQCGSGMGGAVFDIALADGQKGTIEVQEVESIPWTKL